ncbi:MAG: FAD:protein FMN transferase [Salibacteraceae bacterium]
MKRFVIWNPFGLRQGDFYLTIMLFFVIGGCAPKLEKTTAEEFKIAIHGKAQGTTYSIAYYDLQERDFKPQIDSLLARIDQSVSTYQKGSVIDRWNASNSGAEVDALFIHLLCESWNAYLASQGAFDPTVMPLVRYWGFGPERFEHPESVDSAQVIRLKSHMQFDSLYFEGPNGRITLSEMALREALPPSMFLHKPDSNIALDFNAIGQGWSVDKVAEFLESFDIEIYFVEIGGEIRAGRPKPDGEMWRFGIDKPESDISKRSMQAILKLRSRGLATSGSYRKFYERDGVRYAHTIDPTTGYPANHSLLSATVLAPTAADADAMATAYMVMGKDSTLNFLRSRDYLSNYVYLIYDSAGIMKTYTSRSMVKMVEEQ